MRRSIVDWPSHAFLLAHPVEACDIFLQAVKDRPFFELEPADRSSKEHLLTGLAEQDGLVTPAQVNIFASFRLRVAVFLRENECTSNRSAERTGSLERVRPPSNAFCAVSTGNNKSQRYSIRAIGTSHAKINQSGLPLAALARRKSGHSRQAFDHFSG